jgi:hypothetical protein
MRLHVSSRIMARTTLNLDPSVLRELKRRREREGRSLGELASELLAKALADEREGDEAPGPLTWRSQPMRARVDLEDRDAVQSILDREDP